MTQTIEVPIYDDSYKEGDETFWLTPVSTSGYNGNKDITFKNAGEGTIIDNDTNGQVVIEVSSTSADEGDSGTQSASVTISISQALQDDLFVNMSDGNSYKIAAGSTSTQAQVFWGAGVVDTVVDSDGPVTLDIVEFDYFGEDNPNIVTGHGGEVNIVDDDSGDGYGMNDHDFTPPRRDPLVLDTDKDGFISTTPLEESQAYFDITGDGKIDRRDELYSRLKVWHDDNGDGISQSEELKTLKEEGVNAIELNVVGTNIDVNGNRISEAGRYQDTKGNRELAADIELAYKNRLEDNPSIKAEDITVIDPITKSLANLRGYGYVANTFEVYNSDEDFKALAQDFAANKEKGATNFQEFLATWAGYYRMAKSRGIDKSELSPNVIDHTPAKVWILEQFAGTTVDAWRVEVHMGGNLNGGYHTTSFSGEAYINESFDNLVKQYEGKYAIETYYKDLFSDVEYDLGKDEFVINNEDAFYTKVENFSSPLILDLNHNNKLSNSLLDRNIERKAV